MSSSTTSNKYFSITLPVILTFLILLFNKVNSTTEEFISFDIPKFVTDQKNLIFQGSANTTSTGKLQLTKATKNSIGRALYSAPIHIWDSKTGNTAHFETSFTFTITAPSSTNIADGFAFFIAPIDTQPQNIGRAGFLGVFNSQTYNKSIQTVAVEIDTFYNVDWDTNRDRHIGIDVNSIKSISTKSFVLQNGKVGNVLIRFNANTNVLSVSLVYPGIGVYKLDGVVPLKDVVPEWVRIGFSAATGAEFAEHDILSWSFHSNLESSNDLTFNNKNSVNLSSS
ncbi:lectin [Trifolium pratense]|uniref:Lectin n=1 Tax=Trifolium pratense TaxID=57577 RepID=A0A2K3LST1_TRIPR|nr:lectin [Trifolium pratense]